MNWRRKRRLKKVRPGDGSALEHYRLWQVFTRSLFYMDLPRPNALAQNDATTAVMQHSYAVEVNFFADDVTDYSLGQVLDDVGDGIGNLVGLSKSHEPEDESHEPEDERRGRNKAEPGKLPRAPVAVYRDGRQIHRSNLPAAFQVPGGVIEVEASLFGLTRMHYVRDGAELVLQPDGHSLEGLRARFGRKFPVLSRVIGAVAVVILLAGLVVGAPQLLELVTGWDVIAQRVGTFTSPINLPDWANTILFTAGVAAAIERALTLRNHWLIDMDTTWWSLG